MDDNKPNVKHANVSIECALHGALVERAERLGFRGGFSELVARLGNAELATRTGIAHRFPQKFSKKGR